MLRQAYTVEQVAGVLGLHVKTVRGYVRDGRLKAARIGKQYRIAHADLEEFAGRAVAEPAGESERHAEASSIVRIDAVSFDDMSRIRTTLTAATAHARGMRVETAYDEERGTMQIIVLGDLAGTSELLRLIDTLVEDRP